MPLRDHFHPPLKDVRHWESFHASWANNIMRVLNRDVLPKSCFAETQVHVGSAVEIDIATFEHEAANGANGGVAVATWAPPAATATIPAVFPDVIEVQVIRHFGGPHLVGAIEKGVRNGFADTDSRSTCYGVVERLEVLDVHGRHHVDASVENLNNVFVPLAMAAARHVGVSEFVNNACLRLTRDDGIDVHFLHRDAPIFDLASRHDLEIS